MENERMFDVPPGLIVLYANDQDEQKQAKTRELKITKNFPV